MELPAPFFWLHGQIAVDLPGARALFTTKAAGNLGLLTEDPGAPANRARLADRFGIGLAWRKQVHGAEVHVVDAATDPAADWIEADGVVTRTPGVAPLVLAADCLPIVISDGRSVAAIHAGWHGLADGVIAAGVAALDSRAAVHAAIGPGAGPCCYEVGAELLERFSEYDAARGRHLDLTAIARSQLEHAGAAIIHDVGLCTICSAPNLLFSHRREGAGTGRQAGIGWLTS
ncbi:MAG TPA: polyphenol oxidase family protein [Solirubrobacteraceae bacterium]|nr:polyphenol oxidase family protein [Solirubrobacteraceae bacterium]